MMRTGGTAAAAAAPSPLFVPSNTPSMATASSRRSRMRYRHRCLFLGRTSTSDFDTTSCPISTSISMSSWLSFWLSLGSNAVEAVVPRRSIPSLSEYSSESLLKIAISSRSDLDIAPMYSSPSSSLSLNWSLSTCGPTCFSDEKPSSQLQLSWTLPVGCCSISRAFVSATSYCLSNSLKGCRESGLEFSGLGRMPLNVPAGRSCIAPSLPPWLVRLNWPTSRSVFTNAFVLGMDAVI